MTLYNYVFECYFVLFMVEISSIICKQNKQQKNNKNNNNNHHKQIVLRNERNK